MHAPKTHPFIDSFADQGTLEKSEASHRARLASGVIYEVPEPEARAMLDQYSLTLIDAKTAMRARGFEQNAFPEMFNALLKELDAFKLAAVCA